MVLDKLRMMNGTDSFLVEELVSNYLPLEVKFHVFGGEIGAIELVAGRGSSCQCYSIIDTEGNRLDENGCFEPFGSETGVYDSDNCVQVDYDTGRTNGGKIKRDLSLCFDVPDIAPCLLEQMTTTARQIGLRIGPYIRVDMFATDPSSSTNGKYYVQEFASNPMNGLRHCAAQVDENGCVDPCFLGKMWVTAGTTTGLEAALSLTMGGMPVAPPPVTNNATSMLDFGLRTAQENCEAIKAYPKVTPWSCSVGTL